MDKNLVKLYAKEVLVEHEAKYHAKPDQPSIEQEPIRLSHPNCAKCHPLSIPIEQELELGLTATGYIILSNGTGKPCTCIYLPMEKYEEWEKARGFAPVTAMIKFHDIPVFSYSGDKIKYCSCE